MIVDSRRHIDSLSDDEINSLLDRHLFRNPWWCAGEVIVVHPTTAPPEYRCRQCGAIFEQSLASRIFGSGRHKRHAPPYSIEQIGAAMSAQLHTTKFRFALAVRVGLGCQKNSVASVTHEFLNLLTHQTPRLISIAALNALNIIDASGYFFDEPESKGWPHEQRP